MSERTDLGNAAPEKATPRAMLPVAQPAGPGRNAGPRPLPRSLELRLLDRVDWPTTLIAGMSFLLHFGVVGALYSDWADPLVDDRFDVAGLVEVVKELPSPPPAVEHRDTPSANTAGANAAAPTSAPARGTSGRHTGTPTAPGAAASRMADAHAAGLGSELAALDQQMIGALNSGARSTEGVLEQSRVPMGLLEDAAASAAGVGAKDAAGLRLDQGSRFGVPGRRPSLDAIGDTTSQGPASAGSARPVRAPTPMVESGAPEPMGGEIPGAGAVVASLRGGFRGCYRRGLDEDPTMRGSVRVTLRIGPNGEVLAATPSGVVGLSSSVVGCVTGKLQSAQFPPPTGGGATLVVPIKFLPQP